MKIEQKRLDKYIKNLHVSNCPICGKSDWSMTDRVFEVSELIKFQERVTMLSLLFQ